MPAQQVYEKGRRTGRSIMVVVTQLANGLLSLRANYFYRDRIRSIPTAMFDPVTKQWTIHPKSINALEKEFNNRKINGMELVYRTPKWVIMHEPCPDMSTMYKIYDQTIKCPSLNIKLYDYQEYGVRFAIDKIKRYGFCILCDDVGLGKTAQAIGVMKWFMESAGGLYNRFLIICKKSIKRQWRDEINKFMAPGNEWVIRYTSDKDKKSRVKIYDECKNARKVILITNYHNFLNDADLINDISFDFSIIDEAHEVKARNGKMNNNISCVINGIPTMFLTGTPVMSRPEDIFGIIKIANKKYFEGWTKFSERYIVNARTSFGFQTIGVKHLDELRNKVQDVLIRRTEFEVDLQLPKVRIQSVMCDMDNIQTELLDEISRQQQEINEQISSIDSKLLKNSNDTKLRHMREMLDAKNKGFIAAKQAAATDPRLFNMSFSSMFRTIGSTIVPTNYKMSSKTEHILDIVENILSNDRKMILFSKFKTTINLISEEIRKQHKVPVLEYTGEQSDDEREDIINKFKNTDEYNIIAGTEALSAGLNLQVANCIINIDQPDTAAIKTQRIGRARRAGSMYNSVMVYDMITEGLPGYKSKDEERLENIARTTDLTDALVTIDEAQRNALVKAMKAEG